MNLRTAAAVVTPIGIALLPKCPLCLLPLLAVLGVAVPAGWVLDAIVAAIALGWLVLLMRVSRSRKAKLIGLAAVLLLVGGRFAHFMIPASVGAGMMFVVAITRLRERECPRATCASTAAPSTAPCARGPAL